jgi:acyl-CoA synthetase (AMP-forming)/AMP-acid ligase II
VKGLPDPELGEIVAAWLVPRAGSTIDADAIRTHVTDQLSAHKRPRAVFVVDELPRNPMGKVTKAALVVPPG